MRKGMAIAALTGLFLAALTDALQKDAAAQSRGKAKKAVTIADPSRWDFVLTYSTGGSQKGVIRLQNGTIYPGITSVAVGTAAVGEDGLLHIVFVGHPKVANGEAALRKVANGRWEGVLNASTGESRIVMTRN